MKISVALCTYNGESFLLEQLLSVAAQRRIPDELVLCDDGSTDTTMQIVGEFAKSCRFPVRTYINKENIGSSKNFERCIDLCKGDIIVLADQDDVWYPEKLSGVEAFFISNPDYGILFGDADLIDNKGRGLGKRLWAKVGFVKSRRRAINSGHGFSTLLLGNFVTGATMSFRAGWKSLVLPIPCGWAHDYWIALLLAAVAKIGCIDEPLIEYRCHSGQERGVSPGGVVEFFRHFRSLNDVVYRDAAFRRVEVAKRLRESDPIRFSAAILKCEAMAEHLKKRGSLPRNLFRRIITIYAETSNGNYFRHSSGVKSILRDIFSLR